MKHYLLIIFLIALVSCTNQISDKNNQVITKKTDTLASVPTYLDYLKSIQTPLGRTIKFKIFDSIYYRIQWGYKDNLITLPDTFYMDGHEAWIPEYICESKNYIVLRQSCGSPCWTGIFLPMDHTIKPKLIHEYLDFDLENNLVAYIKGENLIAIVNLKSEEIENHKTPKCSSSFIGYCIDTLSIQNKTLMYKWIPKTKIHSKKSSTITEKIRI